MFEELKQSYANTFTLWGRYWKYYGGIKAVVNSLYFGLSVLVALACFNVWRAPAWWDTVIASVPTMLGFTLAGLAVLLGMDSKFSKFISGPGSNGGPSPFVRMISTFVHFVVLQVLALIYAIVCKSLYFELPGMPDWFYWVMAWVTPVAWFIGFLIFIYAIFSMLAATFSILWTSEWLDKFVSLDKDD